MRKRIEKDDILAATEGGMYPGTQDDGSGNDEDARWEELIICSGPSDALNVHAAGYYRIPTTANSKGYTFCRIQDNVVTLIDENAISSACAGYLIEYIRTHTVYYTQSLANFLYNTPKIRLASLERMKLINPDFTSWDERQEHFFFRNGVVRVTARGAERLRPGSTSCMVYEHKIIDHDISVREPFFDIEYTDEYAVLLGRLRAAVPRSPEAGAVRKEIDSLTDSRKYRLVIHRTDCTFMQYVWNTGRQYWRKEELGMPLTEEERSENELHFINKVMALGYLLCKYKSAGQPYAIYAMEMEQSDEGTHMGGTGKSLFVSSLEKLRNQYFVDGQNFGPSKTEFLLQGVVKGVTDTVFLDDLNEMVDLHRFMPMITGKMTVNAKYAPAFTIEYKDSPKVAFTSNHAINKFDASLRRRTWFVAFSDYYHPEDPSRGLSERSPLTEFGKNLISDYTPQEMDDFYTFMFNCLSVFMKLRTRIQPPMDKIEKRNLQRHRVSITFPISFYFPLTI